jgi:DNA helicase-2/ATP-dependent DNA helicase PcrA
MIDRFVAYAKANGTYLKEKLDGFQTLIIDEYQDFNPHEQALIDILIEIISNTYVLGDDDQCIYDFKDASNDKIIAFYNDNGNEKMVHEHKCHRCPDKVVDHASILIKKNTKRIDKKWNKSGKTGELIYKQLTSFVDVAEYVTNEIQKIIKDSPDETVIILSPVQFAATEVTNKLSELSIKHSNYFKDGIPEDLIIDSWKLKVLFGKYKYANLVFLGYKCLQNRKKFYELLKKHLEKGQDFNALFALLANKLPEEVIKSYTNIEQAIQDDEFKKIAELYEKAEGNTDEKRLENIFRAIEDAPDEKIRIMSIHKSKGLDADHVFMVGLIEGIIPNKKKGSDSMESQRRLFYVGMTRAKKNLHLLSNVRIEGKDARTVNLDDFRFDRRQRLWNGKASIFIQELSL